MAPRPRSLILDLLSTLRRGAMPVRGLIAAGELFGLGENSLRVALARLRAQGLVESDQRGRYRLGAAAQPVQRRVASWRRLEERLRPWDGSWVGVHASGRGRPKPAAQALRWLGFRDLERGLAIRPDNWIGGVERLRGELCALGLPQRAPVFGLDGLDEPNERRARSLWPAAALRAGYGRAQRQLERSAERLPRLSESAAMVESFRVGGRVIRLLALDPLLPEPIGPARERAELVEALRSYDRLGRLAWAGFLERFGVPHLRAPADTRMLLDDLGMRRATELAQAGA